jgi:PPOX class probable F420-dependent enzyme
LTALSGARYTLDMDVPPPLRYLLDSTAVAFVSTIGPRGEPQTTPLWFLHTGGEVRISLVEGRQKLRNLRRDPRISLVVVDPARPTRYVELRGRVDHLVPDPERALEQRIAAKYTPVAPDGGAGGRAGGGRSDALRGHSRRRQGHQPELVTADVPTRGQDRWVGSGSDLCASSAPVAVSPPRPPCPAVPAATTPTTTDLDAGWLLDVAVESSGTSGLVSG